MKKVLILLLLFIVACGGSSEEITIEDTSTIPQAPTLDFNIEEIYNNKLITGICSDAMEIDTTSEECLRQYRDNLETLFSYAENLQTHITELNTYFDAYPSAMTEEYKTLFQFIDNEYQAVPKTYGIVANKYIERFGGVPELLDFNISEDLSVGCSAEFNYSYTENLKSGRLTFKNNSNEKIVLNIKNGDVSSLINMVNSGGEFNFIEGTFLNYEDKEYEINLEQSFYVAFPMFRFVKVEFDKTNIKYGEDFNLIIEYEDSKEFKVLQNENMRYSIEVSIRGTEGNYVNNVSWIYLGDNNKEQFGGSVDLENNIVKINIKYFNSPTFEKNNVDFNPLASPFYIDWIGFYRGGGMEEVGLNVNPPVINDNPTEANTNVYTDGIAYGTYIDIENDCTILQQRVLVPIFYNNSLTFEK